MRVQDPLMLRETIRQEDEMTHVPSSEVFQRQDNYLCWRSVTTNAWRRAVCYYSLHVGSQLQNLSWINFSYSLPATITPALVFFSESWTYSTNLIVVLVRSKIDRNGSQPDYAGGVHGECNVFCFVEILRYLTRFHSVYSTHQNQDHVVE